MKLPSLFLLLAAPLACAAVQPQSDANARVTLQADARLVILDVLVTDPAGRPVPDLTRNDFAVFEDKRPQVIRNFEPIQAHAMPSAADGKLLVQSSADLPKIGPAPITVLVLDELNTKFEDVSFGRTSLESFLRRQPKILPQPTTLIAASFRRFLVLQDYTQDRDALLDALRKHRPAYPSELMRTKVSGSGERMAATLASVQEIAIAQAGTPGRKNLVWIGQGFPSLNGALLGQGQRDTIDAALRQITDVMLHGRITLFVIDPGGLQVTPPDSGSAGMVSANPDLLEAWEELDTSTIPFGGPFSFASLAPATGGRSFTNRNDVDAEISASIDAGASYYTLAYAPDSTDPASARYRHIRVEVRRPGLTVLTRDGYFPSRSAQPTGQASASVAAAEAQSSAVRKELSDTRKEIMNAALSSMAYSGMDVHAARAQDGVFQLDVRSADLSWTPLGNGLFHTSVTLLAVSFTRAGKICSNTSHQISGDSAREPAPASPERTLLKLSFDVPSTAAHIRFIVRDAVTGKIGSADLKTAP